MNRSSIVTLFFLLLTSTAIAASLDTIKFIKISPQESRAVIQGTDGKMTVVKPGDTVVDNITVKEIIPGRIILEEKTTRGVETIIVRKDNDKTRIERLRKQADAPKTLVAPAATTPKP